MTITVDDVTFLPGRCYRLGGDFLVLLAGGAALVDRAQSKRAV